MSGGTYSRAEICDGTGWPRGVRFQVVEPESAFYVITAADVGRNIRAWDRTWPSVDYIGRILPRDVGKRVYRVSDGTGHFTLSVENDEQRDRRLGRSTP